MDRRTFLAIAPAGGVLAATDAYATTYFSSQSVLRTMFPAATSFVDKSIALTRPQMAAIGTASRTRVTNPRIVAFEAVSSAGKLGTIFIDQVYGKHEFITFAVALDATGAVKTIEIMEYRESYGDQVRLPAWRAQFVGQRGGPELRVDRQIRNISGATLSCVHITDGVRRLLATYSMALTQRL